MSFGGNGFLLHQNLTADRAVLALGKAGFGTGGLHRRVGFLGVTQRRDLLLRHKDLTADTAAEARGSAGLGAGGIDLGIQGIGVAQGRDNLLGSQHFAALAALGALGEAGLLASRRYGFENDSLMAAAAGTQHQRQGNGE